MVKHSSVVTRLAGFITLSFAIASARGGAVGPSPADRELTVQQAQEDFDLMRRALQEAHAGIYRYASKAQMDAVFEQQRARLNQPMSEARPDPAGGYLVTARLHPGVAEQQPGKYPFLGKVFVLTDGGTFSTAADACAIIRHLGRATFIGQETGGGYYGNNSGLETTLTLPHSGLRITIPMYEYWNAVQGDPGTRRGTVPDHVVELRIQDVLQGQDKALDLAMKLAREG